jgi:tRNA pseudouridine55 synthase
MACIIFILFDGVFIVIEGVLLVDKPVGPSSFDVVRAVRKLSGIKRVGHAGTLDPLASGLMVVCLGRYTKLAGYLTDSSKVYESVFTLGVATNTDDGEGEVIEQKSLEGLNHEAIVAALETFKGTIEQVPPKFSAIKMDGVRAYKMARDEKNFELAARSVEILELEIMKIALPEVHVRVHCSKGTYIRAIARDLGNKLGVGAFASSIRRTKSGSFSLPAAIALDNLSEENLKAGLLLGKDALGGMAVVQFDKQNMLNAKHGRPLSGGIILQEDYGVGFYLGEPVAILKLEKGKIKVVRGL